MTISTGPKGLITNPAPEPKHCPDCDMDYTVSQEDHLMFCEARTCTMCLNSSDRVLPQTDWGRICPACKEDLDSGDFDRNSEEEMEGED